MATELAVLHALAMAGIASTETVAATVEDSADSVAATLEALAREGVVEGVDDRWYVTDAGDDWLTELCRERFDADDRATLAARHEDFEALDRRVKALASEWQETRDPDLVADLRTVHAELETLLDGLPEAVTAVYDPYRRDLAAALDALEEGQEAYFTGTDVDSYHEVWFRLHDDILRTLGAGRHA